MTKAKSKAQRRPFSSKRFIILSAIVVILIIAYIIIRTAT